MVEILCPTRKKTFSLMTAVMYDGTSGGGGAAAAEILGTSLDTVISDSEIVGLIVTYNE